ncbi:Uncharacterised protein [Burkholderia cenocepacia]|jgi:hypothetical protein|nr:Uncharacterised protein [Burkholderia cenocepacia]
MARRQSIALGGNRPKPYIRKVVVTLNLNTQRKVKSEDAGANI